MDREAIELVRSVGVVNAGVESLDDWVGLRFRDDMSEGRSRFGDLSWIWTGSR